MSIIVNLPQNIGKDKNGNSYSTISGDQTITGNVIYTNIVQGTITNSEKDSDDNVITDTYSTKTENSQTLIDAKAYTDEKVSGLVNSAPETLDTLNELAQALGNDANFATTVSTEIGKKANSSDVYTKTETNSLLSGKSDTTHNHDNTYLGINANAVSATNNSSGNELTNTIVKGISISGKTITVTKLDGSTYTLTTQDTNTTYSKLSQFTNDSGYITGSGSCNYASSAGNSDTLDGCHEYQFLRYREETSSSGEGSLWSQIGVKEYLNALPDGLSNTHPWGEVISIPSANGRFEIYCSHTSSAGGGLHYRSGWESDKKEWRYFIDSANIGSQSVNYATSAGNGYDSSGDGWIRFKDGTQICSKSVVCSSATATITYPKAFSNTPMPIICYGDAAGLSGTEDICVKYSYASTFVVYKYNFSSNYRLNYIVVGKWK